MKAACQRVIKPQRLLPGSHVGSACVLPGEWMEKHAMLGAADARSKVTFKETTESAAL